MPNPSPKPYVKRVLARHAGILARELETNKLFTDKIRRIVLRRLGSGSVSLEMIAKELNVSTRSIRRRLRIENTSYKELLGQVRKQLAQDYLRDGSLSINDVSFKLGVSEPSAFHRAFKRWFGVNPGRCHRQAA